MRSFPNDALSAASAERGRSMSEPLTLSPLRSAAKPSPFMANVPSTVPAAFPLRSFTRAVKSRRSNSAFSTAPMLFLRSAELPARLTKLPSLSSALRPFTFMRPESFVTSAVSSFTAGTPSAVNPSRRRTALCLLRFPEASRVIFESAGESPGRLYESFFPRSDALKGRFSPMTLPDALSLTKPPFTEVLRSALRSCSVPVSERRIGSALAGISLGMNTETSAS